MGELWAALDSCPWEITSVVCGCARGPDTMGEEWAKEACIPVKYFPANWDKFGKGAGTIRNGHMAHNADALIAIWDGHSSGTAHMIHLARSKKLKVHIHLI